MPRGRRRMLRGRRMPPRRRRMPGGGSGDCETLYKNNCKSLDGWWVEQDSESRLRG